MYADPEFHAEISATAAVGTKKSKWLSVHVFADDRTIKKQDFETQVPPGQCILEFHPPYSVESTLSVELVQRRYIGLSTRVLGITNFTVEEAEKILLDRNVSALADYMLSNGVAEFRISFSMHANSGKDTILAGNSVADDLRSVLEHLGRSYALFEDVLAFSLRASEIAAAL
ncbi:hypothetical protein FB451DRAFT_1403402 [Mycena latifolia]|nr:hypothetical protein FB451DRAFT_1403402 [Mycena latifolia]